MKKQQLKTGMIVQLRDGWRGLVLKGCSFYFPFTNSSNYLIGTDNNDYMYLDTFDDDLTYEDHDYDIMFVFQPHSPYDLMDVLRNTDNDSDNSDCIFNRQYEEYKNNSN
jgi:hypothetical protein